MRPKAVNIAELIGKTMKSVKNLDGEELIFTTTEGRVFKFYHDQYCYENVRIEDITGDLADLVGEPILMAEEVSSEQSTKANYDTQTWTFYKFATRKGYVDVRWLGESNGYYSERVDFGEVITATKEN